ncbi:hypothetical protein NXC12_CH01782 [Rhizobium etli]|uniref:Uncharacterized protein n=1 Tax=Rhizobium etli TaxID=29449 RepID=A0AAN1BG56_RHIET|nr:hypothetical protein [Rhizobium etli]AGS21554.1 hypothetical protein REMIM1_CH01746 [Rhizobium etli bv. mimosae str. Mim1]ARQ09826.1 hypothetical protein NXC12_CH01782 [Rhizobium etli]
MRNIMPCAFHALRPHRITRGDRRMREKRTAWALIAFSVLLACVELYVVYSAL